MNNDEYKQQDTNSGINSLDWDIEPDRDLWPDISSKIRFADRGLANTLEIKKPRFNWSQIAVAACLVMACAAVVVSSMSYYRVQETYQMQAQYIEYQKAQISLMEQQHAQVRAQFVALLDDQVGNLDPAAVAEIQTVLLTVDEASAEIKRAILAQPTNANYSSLLARTYQRELKLLNKFKNSNERSISDDSIILDGTSI